LKREKILPREFRSDGHHDGPATHVAHSQHGRPECVYTSQNGPREWIEPSKLFGKASSPQSCFQQEVLNSLFPACTTMRRKEKFIPPVL